jgi:hypothetical protein
MQPTRAASLGSSAPILRSLALMFFLGIFLTSCDSGCDDAFAVQKALIISHRAQGEHPRVSAPPSSMPHLLFNGNVNTLVPAFGSTPQNINGVGLMRQPDCSLTEYFLGTFNSAMPD